MRWRLVALIASLPLLAVQAAQTQNTAPVPTCAVACSVNPFTAPANCDCSAPGGEASQTPTEPVPQTQPAPAATQVPVEPGVPSCQLACSVNPFTVPPGCDCNAIVASTGGGAPAAGPGPGLTPAAMVEDGLVTVGEVIDYMADLYRLRIGGVSNYYYYERTIVGQTTPTASVRSPYQIRPASLIPPAVAGSGLSVPRTAGRYGFTPAAFIAQEPLPGVDTVLAVLKFFEKVDRAGHAAMKLIPRSQLGAFGEGDAQVAQALLGLLATLTGSDLAAEPEEEYADDVLKELEALKQAYNNRGPDTDRISLGYYNREGSERQFVNGPTCVGDGGCSVDMIRRFFFAQTGTPLDPPNDVQIGDEHVPCIVWEVREAALASFQLEGQPEGSHPLAAELWFPVAQVIDELAEPDGLLSAGGPDDPARRPYHDRPIRILVMYEDPQGGEPVLISRIYDDFQTIGMAAQIVAATELFEPYKVLLRMGPAVCPGAAGTAEAIPEAGGLEPFDCLQEVKRTFIPRFLTETQRKDFTVNEARPTIEEETEKLADW